MNKKVSLGAVVRDRRLALGYSLGQLATKVNKTAASIRAWERGDSFPGGDEIEALGAALDLDGEFLSGLMPAGDAATPVEVETPSGEIEAPPVEAEAVGVADPWPTPDEVVADDVSEASEEAEASAVGEGEIDDSGEVDDSGDVPDEADEFDEGTEGGEAFAAAVAELTALGAPGPEAGAEAEAAVTESIASQTDVGGEGDPGLHEAMTEAVPVVPASSVAVVEAPGAAGSRPMAVDSFASRASLNPVLRTWDSFLDWYRRIFDPRRPWIYRVRFVLLMIALYILLRVLIWSGGELWDAIGEVLDGIAFSPTETPDVSN